MNALDFLADFATFASTSEYLVLHQDENASASMDLIHDAGVELSAHPIAPEQHHLVQDASKENTACDFSTSPASTQHTFSVPESHLSDPGVASYEYHSVPHSPTQLDNQTPQIFNGYLWEDQSPDLNYEVISITPQTCHQQPEGPPPWTMGHEASDTPFSLDMWYGPQTSYIFQPTQNQDLHCVSFSEEALPIQISYNNSLYDYWAPTQQGYYPSEVIWQARDTNELSYDPKIWQTYDEWALSCGTSGTGFSTM
jgi:hypothetical protein